MIQTFVLAFLALAIAVGGGTASVWYALDTNESFGAERIGPWTAYPAEGRPDADPYSTARRARNAELPLGQAEGLAFYARTDDGGHTLTGRCSYRLEGNVPAARFWTLHVAEPVQSGTQLPVSTVGLHSRQILRKPDGSFVISVGPRPLPGNWLAVARQDNFVLVLTLFDTPVTSTLRAAEQTYPAIQRLHCD